MSDEKIHSIWASAPALFRLETCPRPKYGGELFSERIGIVIPLLKINYKRHFEIVLAYFLIPRLLNLMVRREPFRFANLSSRGIVMDLVKWDSPAPTDLWEAF